MKNRLFIMVGILFLTLLSCSVMKVIGKDVELRGKVIASNYNVPVPSTLVFYIQNQKVQEVVTDEKGKFSCTIKRLS